MNIIRKSFSCTLLLALVFALASCASDEQKITSTLVETNTLRFDEALLKLDTLELMGSTRHLVEAYPHFALDYFKYILYIDSARLFSLEGQTQLKAHLRNFKKMALELNKRSPEINRQQEKFQRLFQHAKFYFPQFKVQPIYFFIGYLDAPAAAIFQHGYGIGIQMYGGDSFSLYQSESAMMMYPNYILRKFNHSWIVPNLATQIVNDLYPSLSTENSSFIEQLINAGKKIYAVKRLVPQTHDSVILNYTAQQLAWCKENKTKLWQYVVSDVSDLYNKDQLVIAKYLGEGPFTQDLPKEAPARLGQWVGYQIVSAFMEKNSSLSLDELMKQNNLFIFQNAKYKP